MNNIFNDDIINAEFAPVNEAAIPQYENLYNELKANITDEAQFNKFLDLICALQETVFRQGFLRALARAELVA